MDVDKLIMEDAQMKLTANVFLAAILTFTNAYAQKNRFWDEDEINPQRAGRSAPQMGSCTREQEYEYVRIGYSIAEIDRLCGALSPEQEEIRDSSMIVPERVLRTGSVLDVFNDGKVLITVTGISLNAKNRIKVSFRIQRPHRRDFFPNRQHGIDLGNGIGETIKFKYRRKLFQITVLDIFLEDQTVKLSVRNLGNA